MPESAIAIDPIEAANPFPARKLGIQSWKELLFLAPIFALFVYSLAPFPVVENSDGVNITIPRMMYCVDELREGRIPYWNEYAFCGMPMLADSNTMAFHPALVLYFLMDPVWAYTATLIILYACLLVGGLLYFREIGLPVAAALAGTLAYALSGQVVFWLLYHGMNLAICMFPLSLFFFRRFENTGRRKWNVFAYLLLSIIAIGGFVQFVAISGAAVILERMNRMSLAALDRRVFNRFLVVALATATGAVIIFPSIEAVLASHRGLVPYCQVILPPTVFLWVSNAMMGGVSGVFGAYPNYFYAIGAVAVALAVHGIRADLKGALSSPLLLFALVPVAVAIAVYVKMIPLTTDPFRGIYLSSFVIALWAAKGVSELSAELQRRGELFMPSEMVNVTLLFLLLGAHFPLALQMGLTIAGGYLIIKSYLYLAARGIFRLPAWIKCDVDKQRIALFTGWLVVLIAVNGMRAQNHVNWSLLHKISEDQIRFPPSVLQNTEGRVIGVGYPYFFREDYAVASRIRSLGGHGSIFPRQIFMRIRDDRLIDPGYIAVTNFRNNSVTDPTLLAKFGVLYLALQNGFSATPGWTKVGTGTDASLYMNPHYVGRAYFVDAHGEIARGATIVGDTNSDVKISAPGSAGETLILSDSWFPGWTCYDNGALAKGFEARGFRGYVLPTSGTHDIEWRYQPASLRIGAATSLISIVAAAGYLLIPMAGRHELAGADDKDVKRRLLSV